MRTYLPLFAFLAFAVTAAASDDSIPPQCTAPGCFLVAQTKILEAEPESRALKIHTDSFSLYAGGIESVRMGRDNLLVVRYGHGESVVLREIWRHDLLNDFPSDLLRQSALSVGELPYIMFARTPKDEEPKEESDKAVWRLAILLKSQLGLETQLFRTSSHGLDIFYYEEPNLLKGMQAYVVDPERKDRYLELTAVRFDNIEQFEAAVISRIFGQEER